MPWQAYVRFLLAQYAMQWATTHGRAPFEAAAFAKIMADQVIGSEFANWRPDQDAAPAPKH